MLYKNLFPYNLAVAGVEHFYLYNNDSSDNYAEVFKPYVTANILR